MKGKKTQTLKINLSHAICNSKNEDIFDHFICHFCRHTIGQSNFYLPTTHIHIFHVSYADQGCIYLITNTVKSVYKCFIYIYIYIYIKMANIFKNFLMAKLISYSSSYYYSYAVDWLNIYYYYSIKYFKRIRLTYIFIMM